MKSKAIAKHCCFLRIFIQLQQCQDKNCMRKLDDVGLANEDATKWQHREQLLDVWNGFPCPKVGRCHGCFEGVGIHGLHERPKAGLQVANGQPSEYNARLRHDANAVRI